MKFKQNYFSKYWLDTHQQPVVEYGAIALGDNCQSDNFLNLGREILNQDSRQILKFFEL